MPRPKRNLSPNFPFHVTARSIHRDSFPLPLNEMWSIFEDYLYLGSKFYEMNIHNFVLMPNHFHLLISDPDMQLPKFMWFLQSMVSREIVRQTKRANQNWGQRYFASRIDSPQYFRHAYKYIYRNPVDSGLTPNAEQYAYSTLNRLIGYGPLRIPIASDSLLFNDVEKTLKWLNESYEEGDRDLLRRGFRRQIFKIPPKRSSRYAASLSLNL